MYRFKNILFSPLGRTDNTGAIRRVADLAQRNSAEMTLFGVIPPPSHLQRLIHRADYHEAVLGVERREMTKRLTRWADLCNGASTATVVQVGDPALSIVGRVVAADHDLVVVTTDDDDEDQTSIHRLLRKCPCPVWVIRPTRARAPRVLAAINPAEDETELNRNILKLAATFVELYGGELHVAHAWQLYGAATVRSSPFLQTEASELDTLLAEEHDLHRRALEELVASSPVASAPWTIHLEEGPPADVVTGLVDQHRINVLVMGTVARTGIQGLVMGNTAERILDSVGCSVIAVKPPGFESPFSHEAE